MIVDALKGDPKARKEILDRTEGRAPSFIDITSKGESIVLTPEERSSKLSKLREKILKRK